MTFGRGAGKSEAIEWELRRWLARNPKSTVARVSIKGTIIEKPVDGEVVGPDLLPAPK